MSFRKLFSFPGPSHFCAGASDRALPSRDFSPELGPDKYCWEDYYSDLKRSYPIKYFFAYTLADLIRYKVFMPVTMPIKNYWYWLKCHVVPSRRYHMLDLRQPGGYQYGWRDPDTRILYAIFNLLNLLVREELQNFYCPSLEECEDDQYGEANKFQRDTYFEILELHKWWNINRKKEEKNRDDLLNAWSDRKRKLKLNDEETRRLLKAYDDAEQACLDKETEMLIRLIKVRKSLWT